MLEEKNASDAKIANETEFSAQQRDAPRGHSGAEKSQDGHPRGRSEAWFFRCEVHLQCVALARHALEVPLDL